MSGCDVIIDRSSSAICDGPSSPIETPECEPTIFTFNLLIASMRMKSAARVRKAANVAGNGIAPRAAMPIAAPSIACSAMKH